MTALPLAPGAWPEAADEAAAAALVGWFADGATGGAVSPRLTLALRALGGNSPFLGDLARRHPEIVRALDAAGPAPVVADALGALAGLSPDAPRPRVRAALRRAKRIVALATAWGDLGGDWRLEDVTGALTRLAEAALALAVDHLLAGEAQRGRLVLRDRRLPSRGSGFAVLGMGKLGAGELNYSSDIDLVLLWDPAVAGDGPAHGEDPASVFARIARDLVSLMETRDADGYVFRVDLRLRPDPGSTPAAMSAPAAIAYYESLAQTWERAAYTKARPVAGDLDAGRAFLAAIGPFVWRRHLDFAAIDDMRAMKARIDAATRAAPPDGPATDPVGRLLGRDLKRGRGGIREIEFVAQTLQLVWGGRDPAHRLRGTTEALARLHERGRLDAGDAAFLARAYRLLRQAEHRLQMRADRQTHSLPADRALFAGVATFMGYARPEAFARALLDATEGVEARFRLLLAAGGEAAPPPHTPGAPLARFRDPGAARARLVRLGGDAPPRALRAARARQLHETILPTLLASIAEGPDPDAALARWEDLVARLSEGVTLLSLLARNGGLVRRIADLLAASPPLADTLARSPGAIEGLLEPAPADPAPARSLRRLLDGRRDPRSLETALDTARPFVRGEEFRLALAELDRRLDVNRAGLARTRLADAVVSLVLDRVRAAHEARHGAAAAGGGLVVVALGRAGARRMMAGSDLDLLLLYDGETQHLAPAVHFGRLAQALIAALAAPGRDGPAYRLDMRLRPSGRAGPVAVSLPAFAQYHRESSWTWERMALVQARPVAGPPDLRRRAQAAIDAALDRDEGPGVAAGNASAMRRRLARDRPAANRFDVKLRAGGLMDVAFVAQALQLGPHPGLRRAVDAEAGLRGLAAHGLLARDDARALAAADRFWRTLESRLRLLAVGPTPPAVLAPAVRDGLAAALGADFETRMETVAADVQARATRLLADPGAGTDG